jgi:hypothetical protein
MKSVHIAGAIVAYVDIIAYYCVLFILYAFVEFIVYVRIIDIQKNIRGTSPTNL